MFDKAFFENYSPDENLLNNKIILVTGAGDGIGKTAALTYAKFGATVVLLGRTIQKLEAVYDEIEKQGHAQPAIFPLNLEGAAEHDYEAMFDTINDEFGRLDGILHNASELGPRTPLAQYPLGEWQKLMQVNLTAPFIMTKALLPLLEKSENASVIVTSSSVGKKGRAFWGAYAVSKAGCENMVQTFADEYDDKPHIRFNTINPGATRTTMRARAYPAENPGTVASPESIMPAYLYLMGNDSNEVNGQQIDAQPQT